MEMSDMKMWLEFEILYLEQDLSDIAYGDELEENFLLMVETRLKVLKEVLSKFQLSEKEVIKC
ncbi:hypothetical protein [Priestia megaterium]|uniref:hypothetical protein n=1 Tax=Priestia megaterium TaxID=1404 RepID=UPI001A9444BC|nr:hypothetical protein [Priestia megaterium]QSX24460.1 hypothetical protein J0P05_33060 [Priestia megaterium]